MELPYEFEGREFLRCPVKYVTAATWAWLKIYGHYRKNHLYFEGGIAGQPAKYLDAMEIIASSIAECEENLRENNREQG